MQCSTTITSDQALELAAASISSIEVNYKLTLRREAYAEPDPRRMLGAFRHVMDMLESYAFQRAGSPMKVLFESGIKGEVIAAMTPRLAELLVLDYPHYVERIDAVDSVEREIEYAARLQRRKTPN